MNGSYEIKNNLKSSNQKFLKEIVNWYESNNTDTIIMIWDQNNKIVHATKLLSRLIRINSINNTRWYNYFPHENVQQITNHFKYSKEKLVIPTIKYLCFENKKSFDYEYNCIVDQIYIEDNLYFICKLKEITDLNHLKNNILDSEKLLSAAEFSAGLVHEIRNPLTALKGFIQLVQGGVRQKEKYYDVMIEEVEKLEKITSELLHTAKPFTNKFIDISIEDIIQDVLFLMNSQSIMKNIQIILNLEKGLQINCNPSQIKQIFINLIKNGSEAMNMNGHLQINSYKTENMAVIEVIDQGEGIPLDKIKELKKPFYTTKSDGTGLGLMITQHILDIHQGELEVFSELNKKTVFRIKLLLNNQV